MRKVDGDVRQLGPRECVVEVVFEEVVFGQVGNIGKLHMWDVGGLKDANIHLEFRVCRICWSDWWGWWGVDLGASLFVGGVFISWLGGFIFVICHVILFQVPWAQRVEIQVLCSVFNGIIVAEVGRGIDRL